MRRLIPAVLAAAFVVVLLAPPADAGDTGEFIKRWGTFGKAPGELGNIYGLALDHRNKVWVADTSNDRVQRFTGGGKFLSEITTLRMPEDLEVGPDKKIYIADSGRNKIKVHGRGGNLKRKWGGSGTGNGQFDFPASLAVSPITGDVYVADRDNNRVQQFEAGSDGVFVREWNGAGDPGGELNMPNGIAIAPASGNVYVADTENDQVQVFDADGNYLDHFDATGSGQNFSRPSMLDVSDGGFLYVTDAPDPGGGNRVVKFDLDGNFLAEWGTQGRGRGKFRSPCGVVATPSGRVYVADFLNSRVQKFEG